MRNQKNIFYFIRVGLLLIILLTFACCNVSVAENTDSNAISADSVHYNQNSIELEKGWNFISTPRRLESGKNTASMFSEIDSGGRSVWTYDSSNGGWKSLTGTEVLKPLFGYWIYSVKQDKVPLSFSSDPLATPPMRQLTAGWNAIGYACTTPASARDALLSAKMDWTQIIGYDASTQTSEVAIINGGDGEFTDQTKLQPMKGYWCYTNNPSMLAALSV